jgi:3',5'-cyclic AMP phosphodiesterase CpdA
VIVHISDTHLLAEDAALYGAIPSGHNLRLALEQLERSEARPEAIVFTGDLADLGEADAYRRLRDLVEPVAERMGSTIIWVMGNHDERLRFSSDLMDEPESEQPQDRVYDINGLRIIAFDSTVPGYHHGDMTAAQLEWLRGVLSEPAPHGTLLAMHHPPIPTPIDLMALIELKGQERLAEVVRGTDVRAILGGHLHYTTHSMFAGIPVSVAAATCYTMDVAAPLTALSGVDGGQAFTFVHVYDDRIVHSVVPIQRFPEVTAFSGVFLEQIAAMSEERRLEVFSNKHAVLTAEEQAALAAAQRA